MSGKNVKISIKFSTLVFFLLAAVIVGAVFLLKNDFKGTQKKNAGSENEIIMPREMGVSDSGFEMKETAITALNAKAVFDSLEEISGKQSLKIYFSENKNASVSINDYLNNIEEEKFYRLGFWSRTNSSEKKDIQVNVDGENGFQKLGNFSFSDSDGTRYIEFNFQAKKEASDLVFTSNDGGKADVWVDDVIVEEIGAESEAEFRDIQPTIFGNTSRFNVDQSQTEENGDSDNFLSFANRKIGQIFQPDQSIISGVTFKIQKVGTGGTGNYYIEIREYNEKLGIISDEPIASRKVYIDYPASVLDEIKDKEQLMREEFEQNETDIKEGMVPNDPTVDQYPPDYTQEKINESKAQKRREKLNLEIAKMKENFNVPYELNIPISARLDKEKKYWIGINNSSVKPNRRNYIKLFFSSRLNAPEGNPGFASKEKGMWREHNALWFKTFYPKHAEVNSRIILSGATISDYGDKYIYRYHFDENDYSSLSGFPGRKIYDIYESNFKQSDNLGNYNLSSEQYVIYRFNTIYPLKKAIIRSAVYNQSLVIDFSTDGNDWQEIFFDDPEEANQDAGPITVYPDSEEDGFYLRIRPAGSSCVLSKIDLEAELKK